MKRYKIELGNFIINRYLTNNPLNVGHRSISVECLGHDQSVSIHQAVFGGQARLLLMVNLVLLQLFVVSWQPGSWLVAVAGLRAGD